jgi:hypothetical protein
MAVSSWERGRSMPEKVKIARLGLKIAGLLFFAAALLFLFILILGNSLVGPGGAVRDLLGNGLLGGAGILLFSVSAAAGMLSLRTAAGVALRDGKARTAGLGLGILLLPLLPFGPVLGGFVLSGLLCGEAGTWFRGPGIPADPGPKSFGGTAGTSGGRTSDDEPGP